MDNKEALVKLRTSADNACMIQNKETLEEFWKAYEAVKETEKQFRKENISTVEKTESSV
jgi:Tfp pilus assembly protein PilE